MIARSIAALLRLLQDNRVDIWKGCGGVIQSGEMLHVLGSPVSDYTTFWNAMAGETYGLSIGNESKSNYHGRSTCQYSCVTCSNECARSQSEEYILHLPRRMWLELPSGRGLQEKLDPWEEPPRGIGKEQNCAGGYCQV